MEKGHSGTVDFTGQGMSFLLIWKCSRDKVMILIPVKNSRNTYRIRECYIHSAGRVTPMIMPASNPSILSTTYYTFEEAKSALFEYIESFYNRKRRHSALDYKTPQQVEDEALAA